MFKLQPLVTTGAGLCLVLPAAVLGDGDLSSLSAALRDTEHALDVLRGIESGAARHGEPAALLRSVTETPIVDGEKRSADRERLRNEVGLLQTELDALDARAFDSAVLVSPAVSSGGSLAAPPAASNGASNAAPGVTTGLTPEQRTALFGNGGDPSGADGAAQRAGTAKLETPPSAAAEPRPAAQSTEDPSYSADPLRHANALYRAGRFQEGFALIAKRSEPEAVYLQARFLERLGRMDEAIRALESVVGLLPEGYESRRAKSDLEFFRWKRDFLKRLPEAAATDARKESGR
jgi:hypothetical protein